ncbi:MAG TPA: hypothetical protein VFZ61_07940 [Polyangiales bacterium]
MLSPELALELELHGSLTKTRNGAELHCDNGSDAQATLVVDAAGSATLALDWDAAALTATGLTRTQAE